VVGSRVAPPHGAVVSLSDLPRQRQLPARGEEQLHPPDRGPAREDQSDAVAPKNRRQAGAGGLPDHQHGSVNRDGSVWRDRCRVPCWTLEALCVDSEAEDRAAAPDVASLPPHAAGRDEADPSPRRNHTHPRHQEHHDAASLRQRCVRLSLFQEEAGLIRFDPVGRSDARLSPRRGAGSGSGARVGHGSDCPHPGSGVCVALEEQVCVCVCVCGLSLSCKEEETKL